MINGCGKYSVLNNSQGQIKYDMATTFSSQVRSPPLKVMGGMSKKKSKDDSMRQELHEHTSLHFK